MSIRIINAVFLSLAILAAALRFWVRFVMLKSGGLDDVLLIFAVLVTICLSSASIVSECLRQKNSTWELSFEDSPEVLPIPHDIMKALYVCYLAYPTALSLTKFSIMATYFRIFPPGPLRKITVVLALTVLSYLISSIFAILFTCIPAQVSWSYCLNGRFFNIKDFFIISSSFDILTNILLCALPIPILWSLGIPKTQRLILLILFCSGALACIPTILRLTRIQLGNKNLILYIVNAIKFFVIEIDTGIIFISIAALRPLFRHIICPCNPHSLNESSLNFNQDLPSTEAKIHDPIEAEPSNYGPKVEPMSFIHRNETKGLEILNKKHISLPAPAFPPSVTFNGVANSKAHCHHSICPVIVHPHIYTDDASTQDNNIDSRHSIYLVTVQPDIYTDNVRSQNNIISHVWPQRTRSLFAIHHAHPAYFYQARCLKKNSSN